MTDATIEELGLEAICPFLWGDDSQEAQNYAAQWIYVNYAAAAYAEFLAQGRGVLAGPFAVGENGELLDCNRLKNALFESGEMWTASVSYIPVGRKDFAAGIPQAEMRKRLMPALNSYNPELEVPILLMRNGQPHVFLPNFRREAFSPRYLYEIRTQARGGGGEVILSGPGRPSPFNNSLTAENFKPISVTLGVR